MHHVTGTLSSALPSNWLNEKQYLYVTGLFDCTSVVIVSEVGVWLSHFWEAFTGTAAVFQTQVINAIRNGDTNNMPSLFPLADAGKY